MERTVPSTATGEIDLYLRTIYSLLRSTMDVQVRTLEEVHAAMNSSLHPQARQMTPDMSAFIYSLLRLPPEMPQVKSVVLGQSASMFAQNGFEDVESWQPVHAPARRRRWFFDGEGTLACFIGSRTDIEDLVPALIAYQLEWNKLNFLLQRIPDNLSVEEAIKDSGKWKHFAEHLQIASQDLGRLEVIWGEKFQSNFENIADHTSDLRIRLLNGSFSEYARSTRVWWENIEEYFSGILQRPVYFISSNMHSLINLISGFALFKRETLMDFLKLPENEGLLAEWEFVRSDSELVRNEENFLYYVFKKYEQSCKDDCFKNEQLSYETDHGITYIPSKHVFDVDAQVIELCQIKPEDLDPRLHGEDYSWLADSNALILNIDYPLGLSAYNILSKVAEHVFPLLGVYSMGKAATLNGVIGDVMIPNVVHDEHSSNTYLFRNAFAADDVTPYLNQGSVLDNQKAVTVLGTFLQNSRIMDVFYREGYTDIEMEAGPFLSAVYEMHRPKRHPVNEIVNLYDLPFDLGVIHYASDTPLSKGKNLGAGTLSYFGMESTYASAMVILKRIFMLEEKRLEETSKQ
ncbi:MAG: hypothetical protein JEZ06_22990 [Anaerolineaceae bacterium]|nr:hypothetical protein [Anaerolineaceae bacterium]